MSSPLDGLASGLSTTDLINQLIQLERAPQTRLIQKKAKSDSIVKALQLLNTKIGQLKTAARFQADPDRWNAKLATSSDAAKVTAAASDAALAGTLSFNVDNLATTGSLASSGTVSTTAATVSTGTLLLATGTSLLGIRSVKAGAGLTVGDHEIEVTQATTAAVKTGSAPLVGATIDGTNDELSMTVNGVVQNLTIDAGTYTAAQLVDEINEESGGTFSASLNGAGHLVLTTAREGSQATIQVTGGDALAGLNLGVDGAAILGTDGTIEVNGVAATVSNTSITQDVLSDDGGTITLTFSGGLREGSKTATAISTGTGTLAETAAAINNAKKGIAAAVVQVAPGSYRLQISATTAGVANDVAIAADAFTGLGTLNSSSIAADATITVGSGAGQYSVTSTTNTVTTLLPGVTLNLKSTGSVTVTIDRNAENIAEGIKGLVDVANNVIADIKANTAFNADTKVGGILMGTQAVRNMQSKLLDAVVSAVSTSALGSASLAGVSTKKDGTLTFDKAKFLAAFSEDPDAVAALFRQGGTASDSDVSFVTATDRTRPGTYAVDITVAGARAAATGLTAPAGEVIALAETIQVRVASKVVSYAAQAGESLTSIADGLNAEMAADELNVVATVEAGRLVLRTTAYGASAAFDVQSDRDDSDANQTGIVDNAGGWEAHVGVDIVGTINGVAASGKGQFLTAPSDDEDLAGLVLAVTATAVGAQGTFEYVPGVAQRLASIADAATDTVTGSLTALIEGRKTEMTRFDEQILRWESRIEMRERQLRKQFTAMEIALQRSTGQQQWLQGQIASMQALNGQR